jgi:hypothetical protein
MQKYLVAFIPGKNKINEEFRKRNEESSLQPTSVAIVYLIFT